MLNVCRKYFNDNGQLVSTSGAGSPGKETDEFKSLTQAAVIKWQIANNISPASGYFGPKSRQVFAAMSGSTGSPVVTSPSTTSSEAAMLAEVVKLKATLAQALEKQNSGTSNTSSSNKSTESIHERIEEILDLLEDARNDVEDIDDADDLKDAEDSLP